ncbi:MAG: nuclear transport factor 2 family protein [Planctomycetia bacterium]|nr:nuclear transport factor 2 family protein [Planctomycetia bacterium]
MLRKSSLAAALFAFAVAFTACGKSESGGGSSSGGSGSGAPSGPDMSTPQASLKLLNEAFTSMDPAKFEAIYTAEAWKEKDGKMQKEIDEMKKDGMSISITWTDADIKVEGDKASVRTKMKFKTKDGKEEEEGETFPMVKVEGKWKFTTK